MTATEGAPRYAVNATSLPHNTVWQDIDDIAATGADGIGLWERKLPDGADRDVAARMKEAGLSATFCVPAVHMVLPSQIDPPGAPRDIPTRLALISASIRRLSAFQPATVLIGPGASGDPVPPRGGGGGAGGVCGYWGGSAPRPPRICDQLATPSRGAARRSRPRQPGDHV